MQEIFRNCIDEENLLSNGKRKFKMDYHIKFKSSDYPICKDAFISLYEVSKYYVDNLSKNMKLSDSRRVSSTRKRKYTDDHLLNFSYREVEEIFKQNLQTDVVDEEMIRAAITPLSPIQQECSEWLRDNFHRYGDHMPNSEDTKVSVLTRSALHDDYVREFKSCSPPKKTLGLSTFLTLWNTLFPNCVVRPFVDIPGKCATCYEIDNLRCCNEDKVVQRQLAHAHLIHRGGMFMRERNEYYKRQREARFKNRGAKKKVLSMIIDGMDQHHCRIPYLGTQESFAYPLKQAITAIKEHDHGVTIYRTTNTATKGANLTMYCILSQIEAWKKRNKCYPEEIYLQVDGGSENANRYVLALMELLVVKRMCKLVYFTRLPTGHTHEDIDACFGVIWKAFRGKHCETLESPNKIITEAFNEEVMDVEIRDVNIIPSHSSILEDFIHSNGLSCLHKELNTQHQWRFEAVEASLHFPLGCKTTYRAYSSSEVVELIKMPKEQCTSIIGRYTGLEPVRVFCRWYPSQTCDPHRLGIEGFYLLRNLPHWEADIPPQSLKEECHVHINKTMAAIRSQFIYNGHNLEIRTSWEEWYKKYAPTNDNADDYVQLLLERRIPYHCPLKAALFDKTLINTSFTLSQHFQESDVVDNSFVWPEMLMAIATNSVVSDFNPTPPPPRIYYNSNQRLNDDMAAFKICTEQYYNDEGGVLSALTVVQLKQLLKEKISFNGEIPSRSAANKKALIKKVKNIDIDNVEIFLKVLSPPDLIFIKQKLSQKSFDLDEEVVSIDSFNVVNRHIMSFSGSKPLSVECMDAMAKLFTKREDRICNAYTEVNRESDDYTVYLTSKILSEQTFESIMVADTDVFLDSIINQNGLSSLYLLKIIVFFVRKRKCDPDQPDDWIMIVLNVKNKVVHIIDPGLIHLAYAEPSTLSYHNLKAKVFACSNKLLSRINEVTATQQQAHGPPIFVNWPLRQFTGSYIQDALEECNNSGVAVITIAYFVTLNCPVYYTNDILANSRNFYAYWLSTGTLPM